MSYKNLLDILKRNGSENIEMPLNDMVPFIRYINRMRYNEKLYFTMGKGKFKVSRNQIITNKTQPV